MNFTNLIQRRKELNITQGELSKTLGISQTHISLIESGKRMPSVTLLDRWCRALKCDLSCVTDLKEIIMLSMIPNGEE